MGAGTTHARAKAPSESQEGGSQPEPRRIAESEPAAPSASAASGQTLAEVRRLIGDAELVLGLE